MKYIVLSFVLACCVFAVHSAPAKSNEFQVKDGLYVITNENYDAALKTFPPTLYVFSASWCTHCKKLHPELVKAAKQLVDRKINARIGTVDVDEEDEIAQEHNVHVIPTLKFYGPDSKFYDYDGQRTAESVINYILRHI